MQNPLKRLVDWLIKRGVLEKRFYDEYPYVNKEYLDALRYLADNNINQRFLYDRNSGQLGPLSRYNIHPLRFFSPVRRETA